MNNNRAPEALVILVTLSLLLFLADGLLTLPFPPLVGAVLIVAAVKLFLWAVR